MVQQADIGTWRSGFGALAVPGSEPHVGDDPSHEVFVLLGLEIDWVLVGVRAVAGRVAVDPHDIVEVAVEFLGPQQVRVGVSEPTSDEGVDLLRVQV